VYVHAFQQTKEVADMSKLHKNAHGSMSYFILLRNALFLWKIWKTKRLSKHAFYCLSQTLSNTVAL